MQNGAIILNKTEANYACRQLNRFSSIGTTFSRKEASSSIPALGHFSLRRYLIIQSSIEFSEVYKKKLSLNIFDKILKLTMTEACSQTREK